jgi:hypothetical protein
VPSSLRTTRAHTIAATLMLLASVWARPCRSEPSGSDSGVTRERAAATYDRGVSAFDRGDYAVSARAFLDADALVPNDDALTNAVAAARRARDRSLLEEAGTRAAQRKNAPDLAELGRQALADARALPEAGPASTPEPSTATAKESTPAAVPTVAAPAGATAPVRTEAPETPRTWSPAIFYAGVGVTAVLTGVVVWSGVDALNAKARLPKVPTVHENQEVMARAHRTDALLAATILTAGATAYIGLRLVAWNPRTAVAASLSPRAASISLKGAF